MPASNSCRNLSPSPSPRYNGDIPSTPSTTRPSLTSPVSSPTTISLWRTTNRFKRFSKLISCVFKFLLVLPPVFLGFPWLYVAAFVVKRKAKVDYSWSEVGWRVFGGLSFSINAAIVLVCLFVLDDSIGDHHRETVEGYIMGLIVFFCGYCGTMSFLYICQAF